MRADWYAAGCSGLDDGTDYATSGDLAKDAGNDLRAALRYSEHNEQIVTEMTALIDVYTARAARAGATTPQGRVQLDFVEKLKAWVALLTPTSQTS